MRNKNKTSDAQLKANAKYDKANFEYFTVKARIGKRLEIKKHAESMGKPLNTWILAAIDEKMAYEKSQYDTIKIHTD